METPKDHAVLSVTTTLGSIDEAQLLARKIIEHRLGACVQVEPGLVSHYRWQGRSCEDKEVRLTVKTLPYMAPALQAFFSEHHPYERPQFLATLMQASAEYAHWVRAEIADSG